MQQHFLFLALFVLSPICDAACVWLRTTGDSGLAWCVDEASGEEGQFVYELDRALQGHMSSIKLHQHINKMYRIHRRRTRQAAAQTAQNWTMVAQNFFDAGINSFSVIGDMFEERRRKLLNQADDGSPLSTCLYWEPKTGDCLNRVSRHEIYMSKQQRAAITEESAAVCDKHGMHAKWNYDDFRTIQRCCCECEIGENHDAEGRYKGFLVPRRFARIPAADN